MLEILISFAGSVASIVGVILVFTHKDTAKSVKGLIVLIAILAIITSALSYKNRVYSSAEYQYAKQQQAEKIRKHEAAIEARNLLDTLPSYTSRYNQGDSQGIVLSGITFLEKYKDIFPDSYSLIKEQALGDLSEAKKKRDSSYYGLILADSAQAILRVLQGIAGVEKANSS